MRRRDASVHALGSTTQWLINGLMTVLLIIGGYAYTTLENRVSRQEGIITAAAITVAALQERSATVRDELIRINLKLDKLLERASAR